MCALFSLVTGGYSTYRSVWSTGWSSNTNTVPVLEKKQRNGYSALLTFRSALLTFRILIFQCLFGEGYGLGG